MMYLTRRLFVFVVLLMPWFPARAQPRTNLSGSILKLIEEKERFIRGFADYAENLYAQREELVRNCQCVKHACSDDFGDAECVDFFGQHPECDLPGRLIDRERPVCRTPPDAAVDELDDWLKESICVYQNITEYVQEECGPDCKSAYVGMSHSPASLTSLIHCFRYERWTLYHLSRKGT